MNFLILSLKFNIMSIAFNAKVVSENPVIDGYLGDPEYRRKDPEWEEDPAYNEHKFDGPYTDW